MMDFGDGIDDGYEVPTPKPRPRANHLAPLEMSEDVNDDDFKPGKSPRKKKKSRHSRLKKEKRENGHAEDDSETTSPSHQLPSAEEDLGLSSRLDSLDIDGLPSFEDEVTNKPPQEGIMEDEAEESPPTSSRKKKKKGGALSRLKERSANQNGSVTSLRSQEVADLRLDAEEDAEVIAAAPRLTATYTSPSDVKSTGNSAEEKHNGAGDGGQQHDKNGETPSILTDLPMASSSGIINEIKKSDTGEKLMEKMNMSSAIESDDEDKELIEANYQHLLSTGKSDTDRKSPANFPTSPITGSIPAPKPSTSTPIARATLLKAGGGTLTKAGSMPDISNSVRSSKRDWETIKSKIGLDGVETMDNATLRKSVSNMSINSTASSGLHTVRISSARHKNFLVGQQSSHSSVMGASELDRTFPDRNIDIFVGTWNLADVKTLEEGVEDFILPTGLEYVPDVLVITSQENSLDRKEWEITLQETIGPNHVIYHSSQHGTLHMAVCMKRELIWFCSVAEDDTVTVRAFKQIKTKGAVAISFTMFGTSMLFIGSHFKANQGNEKARILDYQTINKTLRLPRAVVDNPLQETHPQATMRFDCAFWAGDLNFRITKDRDMVLQMIEAAKHHEHPNFEQLLENDELTQALNRGEIFEDFQEGHIRFPPTYKFDIGTDEYDTSPKFRIPSYTDRILFRCKRKHGVVCQKYDSVMDIKSSDHKPVYGLYQVNLRPGRDTIPLSGGQFRRDIYVEAAKRRALRRVAENIKPPGTGRSAVCTIQ